MHFSVPGGDTGDIATDAQNFLICVEMFPLAIWHAFSFGWNSFREITQEQMDAPKEPVLFAFKFNI
jgi:hypothetical protein